MIIIGKIMIKTKNHNIFSIYIQANFMNGQCLKTFPYMVGFKWKPDMLKVNENFIKSY